MTLRNIYIKAITLLAVVALAMPATTAWAARANNKHILIITSYNPDTERTNANLNEFFDEFKKKTGSNTNISIESMNCKNLSEALQWKARMDTLLIRYRQNPPALIILLGQEAWAAYLAQESEFAHKTPVMAAMVSSNTLELPKAGTNLRTWMPDTKDYTDFKQFNIVGGIFFKYDLDRNIKLIKTIYPETKHIAFLSDFTLGGASLQAFVRKGMKRYPDLELTLIDGRRNTLFAVSTKLKQMPQDHVLLIGTWRIDSSENYVLANTTSVLHAANLNLRAFSMTSVGLGNWAIGGYTPEYYLTGGDIADLATEYLAKGKNSKKLFRICHNSYTFDQSQLNKFNIDAKTLPASAIIVNNASSFYAKNRTLILWVAASLAFLLFCLVFSLYYIARMRKLKKALEVKGRELEVAKEKAEEANRLKTAFIANMSHEIRTPLNAIVGFSELQTMDDYSKEEKVQFGNIVKENSALLLNLINDILDISRIESGRIEMEYGSCDLVKLCHSSLVSVKQARPLEGVEYQEEYPVGSLMISTDAMKLKQVLINLLTNASKFTKKGHIRLSFSLDEQGNTATFAVSDTGIGVPKEKAEQVFERFVKLNQFVQGTGLGLSLCKIIVERLGGRIWLNTNYTEGAQFMFTMPISTPPRNKSEIQEREPDGIKANSTTPKEQQQKK